VPGFHQKKVSFKDIEPNISKHKHSHIRINVQTLNGALAEEVEQQITKRDKDWQNEKNGVRRRNGVL